MLNRTSTNFDLLAAVFPWIKKVHGLNWSSPDSVHGKTLLNVFVICQSVGSLKWKSYKVLARSLVLGQGTHTLHLDQNLARSLRACVFRTLLNTTFYDASPGIIFSLLAPPILDPEFGLHYAACHWYSYFSETYRPPADLSHFITKSRTQLINL